MTTACGSKNEPNACPSLSANSGVISMFAMPFTPSPPNSDPGHFVPQTSDMDTTLPAETNFSGHSLMCGRTCAPASSVQRAPMTAPSPTDTSSLMMTCSATVHAVSLLRLPTYASFQTTALASCACDSTMHPSPTHVYDSMTAPSRTSAF